jgi:hypothetical protein
MKSSKHLSLVAAAVAVAVGSSAYALPPSAWTNSSSPINVYYSGGGSAEVQAIYVAVSQYLTPGTIDVYTDGTGSAKHPQSVSYLIVSGTGNSSAGSLSGKPIGFVYKYSGGSFTNGVAPFLGAGSSLSYPTLGSIASATGAPPGYTGSNPTSVNPDYVFSPTLGNTNTPGWGISDEEPALFLNLWNGNGTTATSTSGATANPLYLAPFGIAVTANVYAQKKNWSAGEIAAVYQGTTNGGYTAWNQLIGDNGSPLTIAGAINIVDRGSGSGSKAAVNDFFFGYPLSTTHFGGSGAPYSVSGTQENNYTGTVLNTTTPNVFQDIKEASSAAVADDLNAANAAGIGAIGVLGLEFPPVFEQTTAGTNSYDFVAINGVYPDAESGSDFINNPAGGSTKYSNVVNGTYNFAFQTSLNYKTAPSGFQALVTGFLGTEAISAANVGAGFPTATDGVLLDPATTGTTDPGNVNWTRSAHSTNTPVFYGNVSPANTDPL